MQIALLEPEIPPNTGNIARLCAAFDVPLHLIEPLGFSLSDKHLKRAGLDYWPHVKASLWPDWRTFASCAAPNARKIMATTKGAKTLDAFVFHKNDIIVFGPETRGLPDDILNQSPDLVRIPIRKMENGGVRSLNLSTACGIFLFTALTQCHLLDPFH